MTSRVLLATCAELPDGDEEDGALLVAACHSAGLDASWAVWNDPAVDWSAAALTVVRATWDYTSHPVEFRRWSDATPNIHNPGAVLRWNSDKAYLRDLERAGIPTVPTTWAGVNEPAQWPEGREFVVKPTVGAGSLGAGRFAAGEFSAAGEHVRSLHAAGRTAMIQPYLAGIDEVGETGLVFIDGMFSHAIRKAPMLAPDTVFSLDRTVSRALFMAERITARQPASDELDLAESALRAALAILGLDDALLYARVDLLPGEHGPVLIELELTEPSLFLSEQPAAADRLAEAMAVRAARA